jgi:hypothetical protein
MSAYRRAQIAAANLAALQEPAPVEAKSGRVSGVTAYRGTVAGSKSTGSRTLTAPITYRAHVSGTAHRAGAVHARTETRGRIRAEAVSMHSHAEIRRLRDDLELLLTL